MIPHEDNTPAPLSAGQATPEFRGQAYDKDEAQQDLRRRRDLPIVNGVYRHYKGGLYVVLAVSLDEATGEPLVTYRSNAHGTCWTRTLRDFQEHLTLSVEPREKLELKLGGFPRFRHEPD